MDCLTIKIKLYRHYHGHGVEVASRRAGSREESYRQAASVRREASVRSGRQQSAGYSGQPDRRRWGWAGESEQRAGPGPGRGWLGEAGERHGRGWGEEGGQRGQSRPEPAAMDYVDMSSLSTSSSSAGSGAAATLPAPLRLQPALGPAPCLVPLRPARLALTPSPPSTVAVPVLTSVRSEQAFPRR